MPGAMARASTSIPTSTKARMRSRISQARGRRKAIAVFANAPSSIYRTLRDTFISGSRPGPVELATRVGLSRLPDLMRISPFTTLSRALEDHFADPRLRQLFGRYATYCGSSPFLAPATLMLVAHVEREGVWIVEGGMARLAGALCELARARGADLRFRRRVARIVVENGRAAGVETDDGERISADAVIWNGDVAALADGSAGLEASRAVARNPACGTIPLGPDLGDDGARRGVSARSPQRVLFARLPSRIR